MVFLSSSRKSPADNTVCLATDSEPTANDVTIQPKRRVNGRRKGASGTETRTITLNQDLQESDSLELKRADHFFSSTWGALFILSLFSVIPEDKSMSLETHPSWVFVHYYQRQFGFLVSVGGKCDFSRHFFPTVLIKNNATIFQPHGWSVWKPTSSSTAITGLQLALVSLVHSVRSSWKFILW